MDRANAQLAFWRCDRCKTPNLAAEYLTNCVGCGASRPVDATVEVRRPPPRWRVVLGRWTLAACWAYAVGLVALIALIAATGDLWWPTTFIVYGPRWAWALPAAVLLPAAALARRRATLWPLAIAAALVVGPILGLCIPWRTLLPGGPTAIARVRVLTCNVQEDKATGLPELIATEVPDLVVVQECQPDGDWLADHLLGRGWHVHRLGGLGLVSRFPIVDIHVLPLDEAASGGGTVIHYELSGPTGPLNVFAVHLETPRDGLEAVLAEKWRGVPALRANIDLRLRESEAASRLIARAQGPTIVAGDFNLPVESLIYRRYWSSLANAFSRAGRGRGHSKFTSKFGIRIDHILTGPGWRARRAKVGPYVGSDHRPVIADLEWIGPGG
jgi:vancomycin resistance protein VanJ